MSTKSTKITMAPELLAKWRPVERMKPDWWWLGTYKQDGDKVELWTQASWIMEGQQIATGRKTVRVYGTCTDGEPAELAVYRGTQVYTLTRVDGIRCGLKIAAEPEPDTEDGAR